MNIQDSITREGFSHHGGGVELELTDFGYEDEYLSAYQNYLGGGMRGAVAHSCTVEDWEMDEKLVQLAGELRDYYNDRFYEFVVVDEYNEATYGRPVSYPGL